MSQLSSYSESIMLGLLRAYASADALADIASKLLILQVIERLCHTEVRKKTLMTMKPAVISILGAAMNHPSRLMRTAALSVRNKWSTIRQEWCKQNPFLRITSWISKLPLTLWRGSILLQSNFYPSKFADKKSVSPQKIRELIRKLAMFKHQNMLENQNYENTRICQKIQSTRTWNFFHLLCGLLYYFKLSYFACVPFRLLRKGTFVLRHAY